ncbi:MAG: apolipoprotein N-acyltransferase [Leptospirales bacterium]|jgi:apolipoprotein N-acyltransferase
MARIVFWSAVCGGVSTLAMAPFQWPLASYLSLWPLFYLGHSLRNSLTGLLAAGLLSSFFCSCFAFHWFVLTIQNFGEPGLWGAVAIFFPLAFVFQFKFVVFMVGFGLSRRYRLPAWLFAGTIGAAADLITPNLFPWYWGNLLAGNAYFAQLAEFVGPAGLSFVLFALSHEAFAAAAAFQRGVFRWRRARWFAFAAIALLALGATRYYQWRAFESELPDLRVAILQTNAPLETTTPEGRRQPRVEAAARKLMSETIPALNAQARAIAARKSRRPIELIVLPESAVPFFSTDDHYLNRRYRVFDPAYRALAVELTKAISDAEHSPAVVLNETNFRVHESENDGRIRARAHNSAALFVNGERVGEYHKERLLPFGEYAPGEGLWHALGLGHVLPSFLRNSRFYPGDREANRPLRVPRFTPGASGYAVGRDETAAAILPTVCYEIIFTEYVRDFLRRPGEAGLLVNLTQDGWYGDTIETHQHFELARLRSVETRRALVRANNAGSSGFVNLTGAIVPPLNADGAPRKSGDRGVLLQDVPLQNEYTTLYMRLGHWWLLLPACAVGFLLLRRARRAGAVSRLRPHSSQD